MKLSIIIPTFNEAQNIAALIHYLKNEEIEIIVCDGGSTDNTIDLAEEAGATVNPSPKKGRAAQMNYGAYMASGDIFYFVHADSFPPKSFVEDIISAVNDGFSIGRYYTKFDSNSRLLKLNAWFTRFDLFECMGGDQTLFVKRELFEKSGGFNEEMLIMEEYEFCKRARKGQRYKIFKAATLVSARKYIGRSWLKVQKANSTIVKMYKRGASQQAMVEMYKKLLG